MNGVEASPSVTAGASDLDGTPGSGDETRRFYSLSVMHVAPALEYPGVDPVLWPHSPLDGCRKWFIGCALCCNQRCNLFCN
ncbi:hypothetical protein GOODEAATRI_002805 [Goodea atripinnis]|uniref:Uncharacterized protein n=1 Tax=Goodea atripinnis TaxID=208336 RepID=A0ABV0PUT7_9TELE